MTLIRSNIEHPSRHCWRTQGIAPTAAMWHIGDPAHTLQWRRYASVERVKSAITRAYSGACHERFASCRYRQHVAPCGAGALVIRIAMYMRARGWKFAMRGMRQTCRELPSALAVTRL